MRNIYGQSLFEVVVAIAISALIMSAIVALTTNSIRSSNFSKNESEASNYGQQLIEFFRGQRDTDTDNFLNNVDPEPPYTGSTTWCFPVLTWTLPSKRTVCNDSDNADRIAGTNFTRQANFSVTHPASPNDPTRTLTVINVEVVVSWKDGNLNRRVMNSTSFSDWRQQ